MAKTKQQVTAVSKRFKQTIGETQKKNEKAITSALIVIQGNAGFYTPQDTNALINSQYRQVAMTDAGIIGRVGYTQSYAAFLHNNTTWRPLQPSERRPAGGAYNPNATHHFLERGAQESIDEIKLIFRKANKL